MPSSPVFQRLGILLFVALIIWVTATALLADLSRVGALLLNLTPSWIAAIITSVLFNYALRFLKWTYFLRCLNLVISWRDSLWIFFSAFTMVLSPGKLGELMKALLIKSRYGIPAARTAPIVMAERLTDLLGLILLAGIGFSRFTYGGMTLEIVTVLVVGGTLLITRPRFWEYLDRHFLARFPRFSRIRGSLKIVEESTTNLLSLKSLVITVPLSAISWAGEGVALYFIFQALQVTRPDLLGISLFAHAFSSIVGAVSFLPGGLLVTEGTLGGFFILAGIGRDQAVSATILIRAVTLWFAVSLGTLVFLSGRRPGELVSMDLPTPSTNT